MKTLALLVMLSVLCASLGAEPPAARLPVTAPAAPLPQRLSETGLNVADSLLCVGVGLMVIYSFFADPDRRRATADDEPAGQPAQS